MDIIMGLFPEKIDKLPRETSKVKSSTPPVILNRMHLGLNKLGMKAACVLFVCGNLALSPGCFRGAQVVPSVQAREARGSRRIHEPLTFADNSRSYDGLADTASLPRMMLP